jgi:cyanate lyase
MRIYFKKDIKEFTKYILMKGYNLNTLSLKIGKHRAYLNGALKQGSLGAEPAKNIAKTLEVDYEELFEIK